MSDSQEEPEPNNTEQVEKKKRQDSKWKTVLGMSLVLLSLAPVFFLAINKQSDSCLRLGSVGIVVLLIPSIILLIVGSLLVINPTRSDRVIATLVILMLVIFLMIPVVIMAKNNLPCHPPVGNTIEPVI